jgi:hypothetical protein
MAEAAPPPPLTWKEFGGVDLLLQLGALILQLDLVQKAGHLAQLGVGFFAHLSSPTENRLCQNEYISQKDSMDFQINKGHS